MATLTKEEREHLELRRAHYSRWLNSPDWNEIIRPHIERAEQDALRALMMTSPADIHEIALWQGMVRAFRAIKDTPEQQLARIARDDQEDENNDAPNESGRRSLRRLLS